MTQRSKHTPSRKPKARRSSTGLQPKTAIKHSEAGTPTPAPTPVITPRAESPWEAGAVNRNASMLTLLVGMQEDHRGEYWPEDGPIGLLARVTRATADDVEIIECVMNTGDGLDHSDTIVRILNRIRSRSGIALEVARRMEAGVL